MKAIIITKKGKNIVEVKNGIDAIRKYPTALKITIEGSKTKTQLILGNNGNFVNSVKK